MKKLTALFFLLLICLTNLPGKLYAWDTGYEWFADSDETETESKEEKKEGKEFTSHAHKKLALPSLLSSIDFACGTFVLPHPALDKPVPPPDFSC